MEILQLPLSKGIPSEFLLHPFKRNINGFVEFIEDWLYHGISIINNKMKPGSDEAVVLFSLKTHLHSPEIPHEIKVSGCAFLAAKHFQKIKYRVGRTVKEVINE